MPISKDDLGIGRLTAAGKHVYYELCRADPATGNYLNSTIYQLDTASGVSELIISIEGDEPFFTNELTCVGDYLFWVHRDSDELKINYFSLVSKKQGTLNAYPASMPDLILSGDEQFLTWYVPNELGISLFCYNTHSNETVCLTKNAATDSPYTRAYINDGIVFFLENREDGRMLIVYNLTSQQQIFSSLLSKDFILTRLQANANYTICTEGYTRESPLFLLNYEYEKFEKVSLEDCDYSIFSCHLYDDYIVVNLNSTRKVILLSLSTGAYYSFDTKTNIIQSAVSPSGLFYGCNPAENLLFFLDIAQQPDNISQ